MSHDEPTNTTLPRGAVVAGVDGSPNADRALAWAARYAELGGRPLVIALALGPLGTPEAAGLHFDGGATYVAVYEQLRTDGEALVRTAAATVAERHPSVETATVVEHRDARQLLLTLSQDAELVVIGSRGRGPLRSLLLGSVASAVAGRAGCPVVVIPAGDDTDGRSESPS